MPAGGIVFAISRESSISLSRYRLIAETIKSKADQPTPGGAGEQGRDKDTARNA